MKTIEVLMSTYNGDKFLNEQIDSVLRQEGVKVNLLVRDDVSRDNTVKILQKYEQEGKLNWYNGENLGPLGSFMDLLFNCPDADYYAFCDQDDVWLSSKLFDSCLIMEKNELLNPDMPVLIHTDMSVVDEKLRVINKSFWDVNGIRPDVLNNFKDLACYNGVNGCTILINNSARELIKRKYFEQHQFIHDVFCALTVSANKGIIDYVDKPTMLYRQHSGNVVGADKQIKFRYIKRFILLFSVLRNNYNNYKVVNRIGRISLISYIWHKIQYIFTKKHGIR